MFAQNNYVNTAIALSSTLTMAMSVASPVFAQAAAQTRFSDVQSSYWANQYVQSLTNANIISGFPDGTFRPDEQMTRAQFASILSGGFSQPAIREPVTFSDVPADHWAANAIAAAYTRGFLSGYPDGTFGLDQPITRLEVLVSLTNGLGLERTGETAELLATFSDRNNIPDWATEAIATATARQLVVNYPTVQQLNPQRNATRAEIAAIAHQALANSGRAAVIASPYVPTVTVASQPTPPTSQPPTPTDQSEVDEFSDLVASLSSNDPTVRRTAADTLAASGSNAVPALVTALESSDVRSRQAAAYALNKIGTAAAMATPTLLEVAEDNDELVRALATSALGNVGLDRGVLTGVLIAALQSESPLVRGIATDMLVNMGADAVPALGALLKNEQANSLAKQTAATLLGDIGQIDTLGNTAVQLGVSALTETLDDGDSDVRKAAARALGEFGPLADVAIPALSRTLKSNNSDVNQTVANSLTKIGQQSVPGLTEALNSDDMLTRLYAADAIWILTQDSSQILPTLVSVLSSGDVESRELAALGLTYLGRQALPALPDVRRLLGSDRDRISSIAQLTLLILNNKNAPAPNLGFLAEEPGEIDSVPAAVEVVNRLWQ
ncbi:MAG: S-layer homology domain-containing protein [Phormidesmis sp.]